MSEHAHFTVICTSEDGDVGFEVLSRDVLQERLDVDYYGPNKRILCGLTRHDLTAEAGLVIIPGAPIALVNKWVVP